MPVTNCRPEPPCVVTDIPKRDNNGSCDFGGGGGKSNNNSNNNNGDNSNNNVVVVVVIIDSVVVNYCYCCSCCVSRTNVVHIGLRTVVPTKSDSGVMF